MGSAAQIQLSCHLENAVHEACVAKVVEASQTSCEAIIAGNMSASALKFLFML